MDMTLLKQIDAYRWAVKSSAHPIVLYGSRALIEEIDGKVLEQISNVATLPGLIGPAMTMPDAHWGYGFPILSRFTVDPADWDIKSVQDYLVSLLRRTPAWNALPDRNWLAHLFCQMKESNILVRCMQE